MKQRRWFVRFTSMWTGQSKISSFDSEKEARWFASQVNGEILDWT